MNSVGIRTRILEAGQRVRSRPWLWTLLGIGLIALPFVLGGAPLLVVSETLIFVLLAMSYNLLMGYTGMPSLGHAAFYGLGAYTVAILTTRYGVGFLPSFLVAPVVSAVAAIPIGYLAVRNYSFVYFVMLTLAAAQVVFLVAFKWTAFTGGDNGLIGVPVSAVLLQPVTFYYFTLGVVAACIAAMYAIVISPYGYMLRAIRENSTRAEFSGLPVTFFRCTIFVVAGFFAGIAGALMTALLRGAFTESLSLMITLKSQLAPLLGGMHVFAGPIVGAVILFWIEHLVTLWVPYWQLVVGLILLVIVLFFREGLVGSWNEFGGQREGQDAGRSMFAHPRGIARQAEERVAAPRVRP